MRNVWEEYYSSFAELPEKLKSPAPFVADSLPVFKRGGFKRVLDLGCGAGRHSVFLAKKGFEVVGVDFSKSSLRMARKWVVKEGLGNIELVCGSMTHLPFRNRVFNLVVSVIHHAVKSIIETTIREVHRALEFEGLFLANLVSTGDHRFGGGEKVEEGTFRIREEFEGHAMEELHHFFTEEEIFQLLAGFTEVKTEPVGQHHQYWKVMAIK